MATQVGIHLRHRHPFFFTRRYGSQFYIGVARQQAQQFDTGVTGATNNTYFNFLSVALSHAEPQKNLTLRHYAMARKELRIQVRQLKPSAAKMPKAPAGARAFVGAGPMTAL